MLIMGRRKRRKLIKPVKRVLPKIFTCPNCGTISVRVVENERKTENESFYEYKVICGNCKVSFVKTLPKKIEHIDIYNEFVDKIMKGEL